MDLFKYPSEALTDNMSHLKVDRRYKVKMHFNPVSLAAKQSSLSTMLFCLVFMILASIHNLPQC